jgi:FAD/FMN-containing dehydrogenase
VHLSTSDTIIPIPELHDTLNGRVITPREPDYDQARTVFVGGIDRHPAVIVKGADTSDVARMVLLARETGLELAVRSGGHSTAGHSVCEGGIVLDLSGMNALDINVEHHTAWAQTGLTAGQYTTAAGAYGLATGFGDTGSVGLGGLTLGGGTCSGPSAAAAATSGWRPASSSACTCWTRSWAGCCCCRPPPR